jgi:hypothetical protein
VASLCGSRSSSRRPDDAANGQARRPIRPHTHPYGRRSLCRLSTRSEPVVVDRASEMSEAVRYRGQAVWVAPAPRLFDASDEAVPVGVEADVTGLVQPNEARHHLLGGLRGPARPAAGLRQVLGRRRRKGTTIPRERPVIGRVAWEARSWIMVSGGFPDGACPGHPPDGVRYGRPVAVGQGGPSRSPAGPLRRTRTLKRSPVNGSVASFESTICSATPCPAAASDRPPLTSRRRCEPVTNSSPNAGRNPGGQR